MSKYVSGVVLAVGASALKMQSAKPTIGDAGTEDLFQGVKGCSIDMDGSLLTDDHKVPQECIDAIKRFQKNVGLAMIATGRPRPDAQMLFDKNDVDLYKRPGVYVNGNQVVGPSGDIIFQNFQKPEYVLKVVEWARKRKAEGISENSIILVSEDNYCIDKNEPWTMHLHQKYGDSEPIELGDNWKSVIDRLFAVHIPIPPHEIEGAKADKLIAEIEALCGGDIYACKMIPDGLTIGAKGVDKAGGFRRLFEMCPELNLSLDTFFHIGDSGNDFELLKQAKVGVAMANAGDNIKAVSDVLTITNNEKGVAKVLNFVSDLQPVVEGKL